MVAFNNCLCSGCDKMYKKETQDKIDILFEKIAEYEEKLEFLYDRVEKNFYKMDQAGILINRHEDYLKKIDTIALCDPDKVMNNQNHLNERLEKLEGLLEFTRALLNGYILISKKTL